MELIGNKKLKAQIEIALSGALRRNTALPHMLFAGSPGCGKTSMARYIAELRGTSFLSVVPNDLKDYKSVMKVLDKLNHDNYDQLGNRIGVIKPTILFLDEVHNLPLKGQELLGLAMERFIIESGHANMFIWVPKFTLVGATTTAGRLSKPFLDRFKLIFPFRLYSNEEMYDIVSAHAKIMKIRLSPASILSIAKRSRGTPRIAVRYTENVRDKMLSCNSEIGTVGLVENVFSNLGIDEEGLTETDVRVIKFLYEAGGQTIGIDNLAMLTDEDRKTIKETIEPFLIRKGFITISGKGRKITNKGIDYVERSGKVEKPLKKEIEFDYERE